MGDLFHIFLGLTPEALGWLDLRTVSTASQSKLAFDRSPCAACSGWCSAGNEKWNEPGGSQIKETTSWMVYRGPSNSHSLPIAPASFYQQVLCHTSGMVVLGVPILIPAPSGSPSQEEWPSWIDRFARFLGGSRDVGYGALAVGRQAGRLRDPIFESFCAL